MYPEQRLLQRPLQTNAVDRSVHQASRETLALRILSSTPHEKPTQRKKMKHNFDELTKSLAQSISRRTALKQFGVGLAGMAVAGFGLNQAQATTNGQLDGNAHPNVGAGVFLQSIFPPTPAPMVCGSGTLIHPRVFLTAGHATALLQTVLGNGSFSLSDMRLSFGSNALDPGSWRNVSNV